MTDSQTWYERLESAIRDSRNGAPRDSVISIVTPTWNTKSAWLAEAAISLLKQSYRDWEWCIVDDASTDVEFHQLFTLLEGLPNVRIKKLVSPHGISLATNEGLWLATGKWVGFLDHDDLLTPDALEEVAGALFADLDAVYSDSDKMTEAGLSYEPFHKPDWSPEFFRGVMYVGHLLCVRLDLAKYIGGFRKEFDGVQDFEFMLRFSEHTSRIGHVSKVLYHWRTVPGSIAGDSNAKPEIEMLQCRAVQEHLNRLGLEATAKPGLYAHRVHIQPRVMDPTAKVTVIIPTKDAPQHLEMCLSSLFEKSTYQNFDVVCMDNNTTDTHALRVMESYPVTRVRWPGRFNFSAVNNMAVSLTKSEFVVFMNNDVEVKSDDWMEQMLYYARQKDAGAVGALLLYPNNTVQHAGVVLGCRGTADHVLRGVPHDGDGYAGSLSCARETSAVTGACLMVSRATFLEVGGFSEHFFTAYQDVDLCLKIKVLGKRNIFTPRAVLIHHESVSRGGFYDSIDRNLLLDMWEPTIEEGDPYFNRNFDVQACDYRLRA